MKMQELGLSIDYCCPACRSCQGCKSAPDTERISLREEAEDQAIRESVNIDFEKKKITCVLYNCKDGLSPSLHNVLCNVSNENLIEGRKGNNKSRAD